MKRQLTSLSIMAAASLMMTSAQAEEIELDSYGCHVNGTFFDSFFDPTPAGVNDAGLNPTLTDQDSLTVSVAGAGAHTVICFFDYDIDAGANTFFNEAGDTGGAPVLGQSWEIDEPGFLFGDIVDNVFAGALDNTNGVPSGLEDDVSLAMGFDFVLAAGETAVVSFFLDIVNNAPGFFLNHFDDDSKMAFDLDVNDPDFLDAPNELYMWANVRIDGGGGPGPMPVPEPGTIGLLGLGLMGIAGMRRRRQAK